MTAFILPSILGQAAANAVLVKAHEDTVEEMEKLRVLADTIMKTGADEQPARCQEFLSLLRSTQESQAVTRAQSLEAVIQLYRGASPEGRWACQRVFFGGASQLKSAFDPWLDLTPYIIEGLTAEETELYLWEALLATSLDNDPNQAAFKAFMGSISAAASRGVINEAAWQVIQNRINRHAKHSIPLVLSFSAKSISRGFSRAQSTAKSRRASGESQGMRGGMGRTTSVGEDY